MQQQKYAVVALDMDGTLLNSNHETTQLTRRILRQADGAGKIIALATGRCLSELRDHVERIGAIRYVICENGACVYDTRAQKSISRIAIKPEDIEFILRLSEEFDAVMQFFMEDQSYLKGSADMDLKPYHLEDFRAVFEQGSIFAEDLPERYRAANAQVDKVNFYFRTPEDREAMRRQLAGRDLITVYSIGIGLEISPAGVNKGRGLERLCAHLNVPLQQSIAIGDGGNDLDIMRTAGLAVAMGNAIPEVTALADAVTEDCDHDGAARAVERYMLA